MENDDLEEDLGSQEDLDLESEDLENNNLDEDLDLENDDLEDVELEENLEDINVKDSTKEEDLDLEGGIDMENDDLEEDLGSQDDLDLEDSNIKDEDLDLENDDLEGVDLEEGLEDAKEEDLDSEEFNINHTSQMDSDKKATSLISDKVANEAKNSIRDLMQTIPSIPSKKHSVLSNAPAFRSGETLEDMVAVMMAPKLEQWMNENLPTLVEKVVRDEIKKIVPNHED
jgi:cell pole-organizing protein PopZ